MSEGLTPPRVRIEEPGRILREHITRRVAEDNALDPFTFRMAELLANRLGDKGVIPSGFVLAAKILVTDCVRGINGYTHEPMPGDLVGLQPFNYGMFELMSADLARDAFGDAFGDGVDEFNAKVNASKPPQQQA